MDTLSLEREDVVWRITLRRPERLNALNETLRQELHQVIREVAEQEDVRLVLLRGAGRAFSAGADLREPMPTSDVWAKRRRTAGGWQRLLDDLEAIPQVTVASLHGRVIGGAFLIAAACDLRIADPDTVFSIPEVAIGIPLSWAGLPRLVREIGLPRSRDLVMTGREVSAVEAHAWGFIQRLAEAGGLETATESLLGELLAMPAAPLEMTRASLTAIGRSSASLEAAWADPDLIAWSLREPEMLEAARRYRERRLRKS